MQNRRLILWIVLGVFVWGAIHAVGAYVNYKFDSPWRVWRGVVVLLFVEAFLAFWLLLLWLRRGRRNPVEKRHAPPNHPYSRR
jgi:hypothetical protein